MNSNNLKLFPVIGLKPIMKTVGFLCPGIYNISNSLEQRTGCISREGSRCPQLCGIQQGIDVGPIQPVQLTNYTGRCGWVFSCTWPHSFLAFKFKFYFNIQMLLSHILLTHKKTWMIKVLANIYVCVCVFPIYGLPLCKLSYSMTCKIHATKFCESIISSRFSVFHGNLSKDYE